METDPYPPLGALKPLGEDIWIVDGPVIRMKYFVVGSIPFPTRMTVVRLSNGGIWLHSPTPVSESLRAEIDALGPVRALVAPNRLHWWWLGDWQAAYPEAAVFAAPGVEEAIAAGAGIGKGAGPERPARIDTILSASPELAWSADIAQILIESGFMTEAVFFHRASRTLVLTDLIENFEPHKVRGAIGRLMMRLGGVMAPNGATPRDLRMTYRRGHRRELRKAAAQMIEWRPARIVIAHGAIIDQGVEAHLRRAFAWTGLK